MHTLDLAVLLLFSLVVFVAGMSFSGSGQSMKSFFAAGGAVPWWVNGLSLFMSFFSAGTFVVWGSIAYSQGAVSLGIQWCMCVAGVLVGWLVAARWRQTGALTAAAYLTARFGPAMQRLYTWLFLLISLFTTGAFLYPVAKIVEVSTGIDISLSIVALGVLITLYTATGGLWAVLVTDVLQFVVLTAAVLVVLPLSVKAVGGLSRFVEQAPEGFFALTTAEYPLFFLAAFALYNTVFLGGNWAYVQRYTSVSGKGEARRVGWLFAGLYAVSPLIWMLPPMLFRVLNPTLQGRAAEGAYLMICKQVLPEGLLGLMLGAMVFATASSVNTTLNIAAGVLTNDVYAPLAPQATERALMRFARLATALLGGLTVAVALLVPHLGGIVEVVLGVAALTGGAMYLPPVWSLFSARQTALSLTSATLISLVVNLFFKFLAPSLLDIRLGRTAEMALGVGLPALVLAAWEVALWLRRAPRWQPKQPTDPASAQTEVQEAKANREGIYKMGWGIVALGGLMMGTGLLAGEGYTLAASAAILLSGGYLVARHR